MKYRDLIQFEPIESVVQLVQSKDHREADRLLETYVISERMAELLTELVFEQLQFDRPADNKGLLIVGNYGTGKSHLMSVIAAVAERSGTSSKLTHPRVAEKAKVIEGRFQVIRTELGATKMSLRDFICGAIEEFLAEKGVDYSFPSAEEIRNHKEPFMEMMTAFHHVFPDQGLLLVVDELLDYLRGRREQELIQDLNFLREVGEICRITRFRFMAGVQEMLFESPTFQFVAQQLRRVRERFEQVQIVREDIAYVVSQRLLKKDEKQKSWIRQHLQRFTKLYDKLQEQLETYVELFPVHPAYLSVFEKVSIAEKREILKTISAEIRKLLDEDVPENAPGVISYDSYWPHLISDVSHRSDPDLREVMQKSETLQDRIEHAFTKPVYKPMALRIVRALSVHRLTTGDIYAKLGLTAEELRDSLFLYVDLPEEDAIFLRTTIETVLKEILKTVSWQYISFNEQNGQYYLDLKKDVDVDSLIEQRAEGLMPHELDRYYFEALALVTECAPNTYVSGYKIWQYELPWFERRVTRPGYLFFGAPVDRSTAQPPRDFYIYMLQPFDPPKFKDEEKPDEVFFILKEKDGVFLKALSRYGGARKLSEQAAAGTRRLYEEKAQEYLRQITRWLRENWVQAFEVKYRGSTKKLQRWVADLPGQASVREMINHVAAHCLAPYFEEKYPDYPAFTKLNTPLTTANLPDYVQDALKYIGGVKTRSGLALLDGLVLLDGDKVSVHRSGYARWVLEKLKDKGEGQVVNRSELIETVSVGKNYDDVERTVEFGMEPELLVVILAALVYHGEIVLTVSGTTYDAMRYEELIRLPLDELKQFSHLKRPGAMPWNTLQAVFELLDIGRGLLNESALEHGVREMNNRARKLLDETVRTLELVRNGIPTWEGPLLNAVQRQEYQEKLERLRDFLDHLLIFDSPAKLRNLKVTAEDVRQQQETLKLIDDVKKRQQRANELTQLATYVLTAQQQLPDDHQWKNEAKQALEALMTALKQGQSGTAEAQRLQSLKHQYQDMYLQWHHQRRLNTTEDAKRQNLLESSGFRVLTALSRIPLLPQVQLHQWEQSLRALKTCAALTKDDLEHHPICPHCGYSPRNEQGGKVTLDDWERRLDDLVHHWKGMLLDNLQRPEIQADLSLLNSAQQESIRRFLAQKELPERVDSTFVEAVRLLLEGIDRVDVRLKEVLDVFGSGDPLTVEDVRHRFERFLREKLGSYTDLKRVRLMVRMEEN